MATNPLPKPVPAPVPVPKDADLDTFARMIETRLAKSGVSAAATQQKDTATAQSALDASLAIMLALDTAAVRQATGDVPRRIWFEPKL